MTTILVARIILGAGALGYLVAFVVVARLRLWMGRNKGRGWPRILMNTFVFLLLLLTLLFAISFAGNFGLVRHLPYPERVALAYGTVGAISLAPWGLTFALWLWWRAERGGGG